MIKQFLYFLVLCLVTISAVAQEVPNVANATQLSPNSAAGAQAGTATVNYFTGIPSVSVPLYSYSGKGMSLSINAEYIGGGGVRDGQEPSIIGMGWYLNAGGLITRTVRGVPDDLSTYGFMNAAAIPIDFKSNGDKYYYDSLDAQPDIFEFNFNGRAGKFFIGKNHQVVAVPQSKLNIQYTTDAASHLITAFKITAENGVKYLFNNGESTKQYVTQGSNYYKSAYSGTFHYSAWYLSQIISSFNTDTIKFTYTSKYLNTVFSYPSTSIVNATSHAQTAFYSSAGTNSSTIVKLTSISFPDQTQVTFDYSNVFQYDDTDYTVSKLKISDSVFRKGFIFDYQTSYSGTIIKYDAAHDQDITSTASYTTNLLLKAITPYTSKETTKGYNFVYNTPYPNFHSFYLKDSVLTAYDHWGFFNGWNNRTDAIPYIPGINLSGANRYPSTARVTENSLAYVYLPTGGAAHYEYEPNSTKAATIQPGNVSLNANASYNINLSQVFSTLHELNFSPGNVSRTGSPPFSGTCNLIFNIKSTDGSVLYATTTISLYDLFYLGLKKWSFSVPNGTYRLESSLSGGGSIPGNYLTQITWNNKIAGTSDAVAGGIRVSKITTQATGDDNINNTITQEFHYTTTNGKSSGFFGEIPKYYYPYQQIITSPSSTTNLNVISSDPVNSLNYAQGSPAGYSHVEVYKGTANKNLGKTVYEFTDLNDVNANYFYATFPYGPENIKEWGLGLPQRILVYDSANNLIQSRTNQYSFSSTTYNTTDFKGLKLGCSATTYTSDPIQYPTTARTNTFIGEEYYISTGRPSLTQTTDTVFHADGSVQTKSVSYTYDSYYNLIKATTSYDRTKGLNLETRIYYPYNYTFTSGAIKTLKDSNIISQVISTEKWITGDANPRMVDATITNFYQLAQKYIVPQHIYKFQNNAPVSQTTIGTFNASTLVRNATYFVEQKYLPVYYGNGVAAQETNIISGQNAAIVLDYNNQYVIAKVSNAAYSDVAYTSFESDGTGNWTTIGSNVRDKTTAITGKQSYSMSNGNITKTGLNTNLTYVIALWAKIGSGGAYINGLPLSNLSSHLGWGLYTITLTGITSITITGGGIIDELRLYPKDANMITYTYEPNIGVTTTCDANNTIIYSEYDNLNRIKLVRDVDNNILKRYDYADESPSINTTANWVATSKYCETGFNNRGKYDSVYTDQNPYSDTYHNTMYVFKGYDYCTCAPNPQYKVVNGSCELGTKVITASVHKDFNDGNGMSWHCTYHYEWSDGSKSANTIEIHPDSPTSPCYVIDP